MYNKLLKNFTNRCTHYKAFVDYVQNTWLTPFKEKFVQAWFDRVMHHGNTTTNRHINYLTLFFFFTFHFVKLKLFFYISFCYIIGLKAHMRDWRSYFMIAWEICVVVGIQWITYLSSSVQWLRLHFRKA